MIVRWLSADPDGEGDLETSRKVGLIKALLLVGIVTLSIFGIHYLMEGRTFMGLLEIGIAVSFVLITIRLHTTRVPGLAGLYLTTVLGLFFLYLIAICGADHAVWAFVFPLVALFLLGHRAGAVVIVPFMCAIGGVFLFRLPDNFANYSAAFEVRFLASLLTVSLIAYAFEVLRLQFQQGSMKKNDDLQTTLAALDHATNALRESEAKYRDVVERASDGILIVQERLIRLANSQFARICGHPLDELIGRDFTEIVHEDVLEATLKRYIDRLEGRPAPQIYESALRHQEGGKIDVEINSGVVSYEGRPAMLALVRDISWRRRAEEEKARLEEQLRHSQKMEAVGKLAGGIAHDFNNMLGAISGFSQMIQRRVGKDDPVLLDYARTIRDTSKRAAELTAKLLAFARKGRIQEAPVDLHAVIRDVVKLLERTIDRRIRVHEDFQATEATVLGDRSQLLNTILNLAVNARDAMPRGGTLTFSTSIHGGSERRAAPPLPNLAPGQYLCITVADTGIGMDADICDQAFEPFFTTKATGQGTGLGLASAYGTLKAHRGEIVLHSDPGRGTTFTLYLPAAAGLPGSMAEDTGEIVLGHGHILVVDDEAPIRELYTAMLQEIGFEVTCVCDGREGIDYFQDHRGDIDLAIVDLVMPRLGGRECIEGLKLLDPELPVIVSSGYSINEEIRRVMKAGATAFMQKPFTLEELAQTVNANLRPGMAAS